MVKKKDEKPKQKMIVEKLKNNSFFQKTIYLKIIFCQKSHSYLFCVLDIEIIYFFRDTIVFILGIFLF